MVDVPFEFAPALQPDMLLVDEQNELVFTFLQELEELADEEIPPENGK